LRFFNRFDIALLLSWSKDQANVVPENGPSEFRGLAESAPGASVRNPDTTVFDSVACGC
jgi:hypothetical protein